MEYITCWKCHGTGDWIDEGDSKCTPCGGQGRLDAARLNWVQDYWQKRLTAGTCSPQKANVQFSLVSKARRQLGLIEQGANTIDPISDDDRAYVNSLDRLEDGISELYEHATVEKRHHQRFHLSVIARLQAEVKVLRQFTA